MTLLHSRLAAAFAFALCATLAIAPVARAAEGDDTGDAPKTDDAKPDEAKPDATKSDKPEGEPGTDQPPKEEAPKTEAPAAPAAKAAPQIDQLSGAPLGPSGARQYNQALTRPPSAMAGRFEISVTMPIQVNPVFTEHVGNGLDLLFHIAEPMGIFVGGTYYWLSTPTDFTDNQLLNRAVQAPTAAEAVATQWEMHAGFEFMPVYAKMAFFANTTLRFGIYVGAGAGVADTKVELAPAASGTQTFGDTGLKPTGFLNAGFRFFIGDHFAIRMEMRDMIYAAYVNTIRGCTESDIAAIANATGMASAACSTAFPGTQGKQDATLADSILTNDNPQSTKIIDNFQFTLGLSVLF